MVSLYKEVQELQKRLESFAQRQVRKVKVNEGRVKLEIVPNEGYWEKKVIHFDIKVKNYPKEPCKVQCKSKITHPNILEIDGEVCLSLFDEDWHQNMRIEDYINGILFILHNPNFDDPLSDHFCIAKERGQLEKAIQDLLN